ncbi:MAG: hypothetical protein O6949_06170 [Chloroflexi bacterium]|nr:hypothetical protein [Chloroflexota bacterium]
MTPVVNGLETTFGEQVEIRSLNAAFGDGRSAIQNYAIPGHPSNVILDPQGEVLWSAFGPQSAGALEAEVEEAISQVTGGH